MSSIPVAFGPVIGALLASLWADTAHAVDLTVDTTNANTPFAVTTSQTYGQIVIGDTTTGTVNLSSGTLTATSAGFNISIGNNAGSTGFLNLSGGTISGSFTIGTAGSGTVVQTGGTLSGPLIEIGGGIGSTGSYTMSAGTMSSAGAGIGIGVGGTGTLTISGTAVITAAVGSVFQVGEIPASQGTVNFDGGTIIAPSISTFGGTSTFNFNGGTLRTDAASVTFMQGLTTVNVRNGGAIIDSNGFNITIAQALLHSTIGGDAAIDGGLTKRGTGTLTLSGANTYTGGTTISAGTLRLTGAGTLGAVTGTTTLSSGAVLDLGGTTQTQAALNLSGGTLQNGNLNAAIISTGGTINAIGGTASLTTTAGTTLVTGTNTYTGPTIVNGGILNVTGSITDPTVNAGGTLMGTGTVGATQVNAGGTFAPGNGTAGTSMTVAGNLAFQAGAIYLIQISPAAASFATVTGTATLGGANVSAVFANGSYVARQYTILTAAGGVAGTFAAVTNTNLPANFRTTLSYDANNAYLNLILNFSVPGGLNTNQKAVGDALTRSFNANGGIPLLYGALSAAGLTQASGEIATSSQQTTFDAMNLFMGLLTDPFTAGRGDQASAGGGSAAYADESMAYAAKSKHTDAFAMFTKAPPAVFMPSWSVWAAGYGGSQRTDGNTTLGSNDTRSSVYGTAVGADYRLAPNTLAGFALAGGGTNFSVNGLGGGRSDLFQAGAYARHNEGAAYITGALAYGWQDITTDRTVTIAGADRLRAEFNANAWSGRVEGGYRFVAPAMGGVGLTPYAAGQFVTFALPAYAETVVSGTPNFALTYAGKTVTDTRSELGLRTDKSLAMQDAMLTLRGRLAWAHDFDPNRTAAATFLALPGASFVVNGAAHTADAALTTASAEWKWQGGWSAAATFEGEFSNVTRSYAGKGVVRYTW